jgi:hypothetical protein
VAAALHKTAETAVVTHLPERPEARVA